MPTAIAQDRVTAARFEISIDGHTIAMFGGLQLIAAEAKGLQEFSNDTRGRGVVQLTRPLTPSQEIWAWHELAVNSGYEAGRKDAMLVAYNRDGQAVARYKLTNAWPAKIEIGTLKAGASEVLLETVTLVCESIQRVAV